MKTAKEIREMLKEPGKNVYIQFADGGLAHRIIGVRYSRMLFFKNEKTTCVKCTTFNDSKYFAICSTDVIFCQ